VLPATVLLSAMSFTSLPDTVKLDLMMHDWSSSAIGPKEFLHGLDADIAAVLGSAESPHEMSQHLIELANGRGGRDNVSVIVVKAQEPPRKPGMMAKLLRK